MKRRSLLVGAAFGTTFARASGLLDKVRWLPEDRIDIATVALTLGQEFQPSLDIPAYSRQIDSIAAAIAFRTRGSPDPEERVYWMNTVLFKEMGYRYDHDPLARKKERNVLLTGILDTRLGICATMPLLYLAVGQRLRYPIALVCVPDHQFVRYVDPGLDPGNVETTSGGKRFTDKDYIDNYRVNKTALSAGTYMRPLSRRECVANLITASAYVHGLRMNVAKALEYLQAAVLLDPRRAETYEQIGACHDYFSKLARGIESARHAEQYRLMTKKALDMGYVAIDIDGGQQRRGVRGL